MQNVQRLIIFIGLGIIVLMGIFPPWSFVDENKVAHSMGFGPIWKPPVVRSRDTADLFGFKLEFNLESRAANAIDLPRLIAQIAIVALVTGGAVFLLKRGSG